MSYKKMSVIAVEELLPKKPVNKGGRPRKTVRELQSITEKRQLLKLEDYLSDAHRDIAALRKLSKDGSVTNAQVSALSKALNGSLNLINKILPDLKATEITGALEHQHKHQVVDNRELAMRLARWRGENHNLLKNVIDITPKRIVPEGSENVDRLDGLNLPTPEPEYDFL